MDFLRRELRKAFVERLELCIEPFAEGLACLAARPKINRQEAGRVPVAESTPLDEGGQILGRIVVLEDLSIGVTAVWRIPFSLLREPEYRDRRLSTE